MRSDPVDAVEHYAALLGHEVLPSEALCLTAVRRVAVPEALIRFDGFPGQRRCTIAAAGEVSVRAYPDELEVAGDYDRQTGGPSWRRTTANTGPGRRSCRRCRATRSQSVRTGTSTRTASSATPRTVG
jgi:hypothetical protein